LQRIVHQGLDQLRRSWPVAALRMRRYERRFAAAEQPVRMFRGIYESYAAASAAAPATRPVGRDNALNARRLEHERHRIFASDYPVLFWLSRLLADSRFLFDLGGDVGTSFSAFRGILPYPPGFTWLVQDVPAIVAHGRSLSGAEPGLRFTEDYDELGAADILLASGSLQFLPDPLWFVRDGQTLPPHVLVNKIPLYDEPSAVTLESNGAAFLPYHLLNRAQFLAAFAQAGYEPVDAWRNYDLNCYVPFHERHTIPYYSGYYFRRASG
jgi:putative methyltransferase (TIGR04325 family)